MPSSCAKKDAASFQNGRDENINQLRNGWYQQRDLTSAATLDFKDQNKKKQQKKF